MGDFENYIHNIHTNKFNFMLPSVYGENVPLLLQRPLFLTSALKKLACQKTEGIQ